MKKESHCGVDFRHTALTAIISICSSSSRWNDRRKQNTSGTKRGMGCMV